MAGTDSNIDREKRFLKALEGLVRTAREQGGVTSPEELEETFKDFELDETQQGLVRSYLAAHHVGIGEAVDTGESLSDEEHRYLDDYLEQLSFIKPASDGEKLALAMSAMNGDKAARDRLIEVNLQNVADVAKLYTEQGVYLEDLIGEGNAALARGVTMLDAVGEPAEVEQFLLKLSMDAMEELIAENLDEDARGQAAVRLVQEVADKAAELSQELRRSCTVEELMEETGWERDKILEAVRLTGDRIEEINTSGVDLYDRAVRERAEEAFERAKGTLYRGGDSGSK